jgi:hypothetical protein
LNARRNLHQIHARARAFFSFLSRPIAGERGTGALMMQLRGPSGLLEKNISGGSAAKTTTTTQPQQHQNKKEKKITKYL